MIMYYDDCVATTTMYTTPIYIILFKDGIEYSKLNYYLSYCNKLYNINAVLLALLLLS